MKKNPQRETDNLNQIFRLKQDRRKWQAESSQEPSRWARVQTWVIYFSGKDFHGRKKRKSVRKTA